MKRQRFSADRRRLLQGALGAVAAAPVVGLATARDAPVARTAGACEASPCIRSPWVHYPLDSTWLDANGDALDIGNESLPALAPGSADTGQWDELPGWWTGNGVDRVMTGSVQPAVDGSTSVLMPNRSACLIGLQLQKTEPVTTGESLLRIGKLLPGGVGRGLHLTINIYGKPIITLWDDAGNEFALAGRHVISATNGGNCTLFLYLDHRPEGSRTLSIHQYETGTVVQNGRVRSTHELGPITGEAAPDNRILVGARQLPSGTIDQYYRGNLRNLVILNFGRTPPANVSGIMDSLAANDMQPGASMVGV